MFSPVQDEEPGHTLGPGVRHHRLQELVDRDLVPLAKDQVPAVLLHVESVPLPHGRGKLHDVFEILNEPETEAIDIRRIDRRKKQTSFRVDRVKPCN